MTDPPYLSGRVEVGGVLRAEFTDAEAYEDVVARLGHPAAGSAHFECSFPPLRDEDARRVVLWGARRDDVQLGSPEDRWQQLRRAGELKLVVPRVRYASRPGPPPPVVEFTAVNHAYEQLRRTGLS